MKILFVATTRVIEEVGGVPKAISSFANEFVKRGHRVEWVCMRKKKGGIHFPLDPRVRFTNLYYQGKSYGGVCYFARKIGTELSNLTVKLGMQNRSTRWDPKKSFLEREFIARLQKYMEGNRPDIILTDEPQALRLAQIAVKGEIPVITQTHNAPLAFEGLPFCDKEAMAHAAAVQVLLPSYVKIFEQMGAKNVVYIPNIVEQTEETKTVDLSLDHHTIINVARVERNQKRQHLLLEAFAKIAHSYPDRKVVIYGAVDNRRYMRYLRDILHQNSIEDRVIFAGETDDVQGALGEADFFVLPSAYEGFPLALTEAMSIGLPVIGYKSCPGVNELISSGENGLLCEDGAEPLAKAMETLMQDQELRINYGRNAREAMKKFAPERVYDRWEQLLKETIEKYRSAEEKRSS